MFWRLLRWYGKCEGGGGNLVFSNITPEHGVFWETSQPPKQFMKNVLSFWAVTKPLVVAVYRGFYHPNLLGIIRSGSLWSNQHVFMEGHLWVLNVVQLGMDVPNQQSQYWLNKLIEFKWWYFQSFDETNFALIRVVAGKFKCLPGLCEKSCPCQAEPSSPIPRRPWIAVARHRRLPT